MMHGQQNVKFWLVFVTNMECVYCAVRPESLNVIRLMLIFKIYKSTQLFVNFPINHYTSM